MPSTEKIKLSGKELLGARRRAAFIYVVINDMRNRAYLRSTFENLQAALYLMESAAEVPLGLKYVLYREPSEPWEGEWVHSFRLDVELTALVGSDYLFIPKTKEFIPGHKWYVQENKNNNKREVELYHRRTLTFLEYLTLFSPPLLNLVSLAWFLHQTTPDGQLVKVLRQKRNNTRKSWLEAAARFVPTLTQLKKS